MARRWTHHPLLAVAIVAGFACHRSQASTPAEWEPVTPPFGIAQFVDGETGETTVGPELTVEFGRLRIGTTSTREVLVRNAGTVAFTLSPTEANPPSAFDWEASRRTMSAGEVGSILVAFRPSTAGAVEATLGLSVDCGEPTRLVVHLDGTGTDARSPSLELAPAQLDFGEVSVGTYKVLQVIVANIGADVAGTADDNLRFGVRDEDGLWVEQRPQLTGPDATEFSLEAWPPVGYGAAGMAMDERMAIGVRLSATSAGRKAALLTLRSNDPERPLIEVPLYGIAANRPACDLQIAPGSLNFGNVIATQEVTQAVEIRNVAAAPGQSCAIAGIDLSDETRSSGGFTLVDGPLGAVQLEPGESLELPVRFRPLQERAWTGDLEVRFSSPGPATQFIALTGYSGSECLSVQQTLDFGTIWLGCKSRQKTVAIVNACNFPVTVVSIEIASSTSADAFAITKKLALPISIAPAGTAEFGVRFFAERFGDEAASIHIFEQGRSAPLVVTISGKGFASPAQTDVFFQSDRPKIDVLFVVDNSATMADKQSKLINNVTQFADLMAQQQTDFHIAVTTTDVSASNEAGRFVPLTGTDPRVVTPTTPNLQQVMKQNLMVGTSGNETESLLRPAYLALSAPLVTSDNAAFRRDWETLEVIIISDAADQDPLETPVAYYENFLASLDGPWRVSIVHVSAIIPTRSQAPAGCSYDSPAAGTDSRVKQIVQRTGGSLGEICDSDWMSVLGRMSRRVFGLRTTFFLSNLPDMSVTPEPITITIDGQWYPQFDARGAKRWDYNGTSNAIEFDPVFAPPPGSTLSVSYRPLCL